MKQGEEQCNGKAAGAKVHRRELGKVWARHQPRTGNVHGSDDSGVWCRTCGVRLLRWQLQGTRGGHRTNAEQTRQKERGGRRRKGPELWSAHSGTAPPPRATTAGSTLGSPAASWRCLMSPNVRRGEASGPAKASSPPPPPPLSAPPPSPPRGWGEEHGSARRKGHGGETRAAVPTPEHEPPSQRA